MGIIHGKYQALENLPLHHSHNEGFRSRQKLASQLGKTQPLSLSSKDVLIHCAV